MSPELTPPFWMRPLGNISKPEGLRDLRCSGQDAGSQHPGAESGNLHSSPIYTVHWQQKPGKDALLSQPLLFFLALVTELTIKIEFLNNIFILKCQDMLIHNPSHHFFQASL